MTNELETCPFCPDGGIPLRTQCGEEPDVLWYSCRCSKCGASVGEYDTAEEADAAWNTRYKRTCRNVYKENRHAMDQCENGFECSECGNVIEDYEHCAVKGTFNFCSNCGSEVVDD